MGKQSRKDNFYRCFPVLLGDDLSIAQPSSVRVVPSVSFRGNSQQETVQRSSPVKKFLIINAGPALAERQAAR